MTTQTHAVSASHCNSIQAAFNGNPSCTMAVATGGAEGSAKASQREIDWDQLDVKRFLVLGVASFSVGGKLVCMHWLCHMAAIGTGRTPVSMWSSRLSLCLTVQAVTTVLYPLTVVKTVQQAASEPLVRAGRGRGQALFNSR